MKTGIYIHIPFCAHKCSYCDFNAYSGLNDQISDCVDAICRDIERSPYSGTIIDTVFFGGGTPTQLTVNQYADILNAIHCHFKVNSKAEISTEANPTSSEIEKFVGLKALGINRLSIGVQAFQQHLLTQIERQHSGEDGIRAVETAIDSGFINVSVDLMFGLPLQTIDDWYETLQRAVNLPIKHISAYALTIEAGTRFERLYRASKLALPDEDAEFEMYQLTRSFLPTKGFSQYEISNFAQPGFECLHNQIYWWNEQYLGFGPGAVSYFNSERWTALKQPKSYIRNVMTGGDHKYFSETLNDYGQLVETLIAGLRLTTGLTWSRLNARFGMKLIDNLKPRLETLETEGLIHNSTDRIRLTEAGFRWADSVFIQLLPD